MKEFDRSIIARYINGRCSEEELSQLVAWVNSSDDNARDFFASEQMHLCLKEFAMPHDMEDDAMERMHGLLAKENDDAAL